MMTFYLNSGAKQNLFRYGADQARSRFAMYGCWGVDTNEFSPDGDRVRLAKDPNEIVLLYVGRLAEAKGVFDILSAFNAVQSRLDQPVRLVIIGDGAERSRVTETVHRLGLSQRVDILGTIKNRDLPAYMRASDIFVLAPKSNRLWSEQVGMVFLQAMATGVPIVATNSGSIQEFVPDGQAGFLVPESDPSALAEAIVRLSSDPELRLKFGIQGLELTRSRYDIVKNITLIERLIVQEFMNTLL